MHISLRPFAYVLLASLVFSGTQLFAQESSRPDTPSTNEPAASPITPPENNSVIETGDTIDRLFEKLRKDPKPRTAKATANMIWREWSHSGSKSVDLLMSWANRAMTDSENARALDLLDQVVTIAPDYAEGWNRRATLFFLMSRFSQSIADIERTLALEPRHFGALSGLAAIMQRFERDEDALATWYRVLEIYPANEAAQKAVIQLEEKLAGQRT